MLSHVSTIILHIFYAFCRTNLLTRCPVLVPCFCYLFVSEIYFWKYSRIALEIYGEFLFTTMKYQSEGEPEGRPTGQVCPPAAGQGGPTDGACPCPWDLVSAPSDAYKLLFDLKMLRRPLFSRNSTPTRRHRKPCSGSNLKLIPALCRRGDRSRRALHRHAFLRDDW